MLEQVDVLLRSYGAFRQVDILSLVEAIEVEAEQVRLEAFVEGLRTRLHERRAGDVVDIKDVAVDDGDAALHNLAGRGSPAYPMFVDDVVAGRGDCRAAVHAV